MNATLEAIQRLSRDEAKAAASMNLDEIRYLVQAYYDIQDKRIAAAHQVSQLSKRGEPHETLSWLFRQNDVLESQIKRALHHWVQQRQLGQWLMEIVGIGPVIASGLIAYTHSDQAYPSVVDLWAYAGYAPDKRWEKGQKRPWNAALKVLCWKAGQSFVKVQNHEDDIYGKVIVARKKYEWERNLSGALADQAKAKLERYKIGQDTASYHWYAGNLTVEAAQRLLETKPASIPAEVITPGEGVPMLPPAHIQARAERYGVKLFLSHFHEVSFYLKHGQRPLLPYAINQLGHTGYIQPPNTWMFVNDWNSVPHMQIAPRGV